MYKQYVHPFSDHVRALIQASILFPVLLTFRIRTFLTSDSATLNTSFLVEVNQHHACFFRGLISLMRTIE